MRPLLIVTAALAAHSVPSPLVAQAAQPGAISVEALTPVAGGWSYRSYPGGSEAAFADAGGTRLVIRCNRAARLVSIVRNGVPAATASLSVWTTSASRTVPARFAAPLTLTADFAAMDPLLDALSLSRGKFATSALGAPLTAYPTSGEQSRVIEDCRS